MEMAHFVRHFFCLPFKPLNNSLTRPGLQTQ